MSCHERLKRLSREEENPPWNRLLRTEDRPSKCDTPSPITRPDPRRKQIIYDGVYEAPTLPFGKLLAAGGALIKVPSVRP